VIINFLLGSLKEHPDSLRKLLLIKGGSSRPSDLAVQNCRAKAVAYLLDYVKDDYETLQELMVGASGKNPLHAAAEKGCFEVLKILLGYLQNYPRILEQLFAEPNYKSITALHVALKNEHFDIVEL
jgi:ankyrin repeat protein